MILGSDHVSGRVGGVRLALALTASLLGACAADGPPPDPPGPLPSVIIENQSQYTLLELRIHDEADYLESPNMIADPLALDDHVFFYGAGNVWVTVFREKYAMGPILAFTTASPISLYRGKGYRLIVFDESFRLLSEPYVEPEAADAPIVGGGPST